MGESAKPVPKWRACPDCGGLLSGRDLLVNRTACLHCGRTIQRAAWGVVLPFVVIGVAIFFIEKAHVRLDGWFTFHLSPWLGSGAVGALAEPVVLIAVGGLLYLALLPLRRWRGVSDAALAKERSHLRHARPGPGGKPTAKWRTCPACGGSLSLVSKPDRWRNVFRDDDDRRICPHCDIILVTTAGNRLVTVLFGFAVVLPPLMVLLSTNVIRDLPYPLMAGLCALMATGIALPAVLGKRWAIDRVANRSYCSKCGYDLRGTLAAGGTACPECGMPIATGKDDA